MWRLPNVADEKACFTLAAAFSMVIIAAPFSWESEDITKHALAGGNDITAEFYGTCVFLVGNNTHTADPASAGNGAVRADFSEALFRIIGISPDILGVSTGAGLLSILVRGCFSLI